MRAGVTLTEYRAMSPAFADALATRYVERHRQFEESRDEATAHAVGAVLRIVVARLAGVERAVYLTRPRF